MHFNKLEQLLEALAGRSVLVVGDAMLDEYVLGTTDRVSREAPIPVVRFDSEERRLGGAGNAARNVVALGGAVAMASIVGGDDKGRALVNALRAAGVDAEAVVRERGRITLTKLRVMAGAPGTGKQQVLRLDRQPAADPRHETRQALRAAVRKALPRCDAVLVSDYGGGVIDTELIRLLARAARRRPVIVDSRYQLTAYRGPFYLKPNAPELAAATGLPAGDDREVLRASRSLRERTGAQAVLTTRGRAGMSLVVGPRGGRHLPIFGRGGVTDVTGAGDTVAAAIALALAGGAQLPEAMALATVAAGIVVQQPGAATASPAAISRALQEQQS